MRTKLRITDSQGGLLGVIRQTGLNRHLCLDEEASQRILTVTNPRSFGIGRQRKVLNPATGEHYGSLRLEWTPWPKRWVICDRDEVPIGEIVRDSIEREWCHIRLGDQVVATVKRSNKSIRVEFAPGNEQPLPRALCVAAAVLVTQIGPWGVLF
jgi:hypothetical protein